MSLYVKIACRIISVLFYKWEHWLGNSPDILIRPCPLECLQSVLKRGPCLKCIPSCTCFSFLLEDEPQYGEPIFSSYENLKSFNIKIMILKLMWNKTSLFNVTGSSFYFVVFPQVANVKMVAQQQFISNMLRSVVRQLHLANWVILVFTVSACFCSCHLLSSCDRRIFRATPYLSLLTVFMLRAKPPSKSLSIY